MDARVHEEIDRRGMERSRIMILDALLKLRQVCCHPQLLKVDAAKAVKESAKLEALMELVEPLVAEGRRMLVFSQFVEMLQVIRERLKASGIEPLLLTGQTKKRGALVEEFQKGASPVFLISLKAGGTGLNLTAADTVIHYDPWWNPAAEAQATDRAHRMGQRSTVFVHKLICEGTIEERILELQQRKSALVAGLLDASAPAVALTAEDLEMLLSPIG
jgi:SNF2 family DNA or RNA helicase